ncbi:Sortilin-related receptor [Amphibalanus amphitrite]|uniref:Sortilin-related receptor n=1 Tax=Amphibalanus amphitrite TaxID=1232801 RepID=A0A6A4WW93_AMPAM|nr:Sortilin-related receptor [Amphibalanus amphitrite]
MARHPARGILLLMWVLCVSVRCQATQTEETPTPPMGVEPGKGDDALERLTVLVSSALKNALDPITSELNGQRTTLKDIVDKLNHQDTRIELLNTRLDSINARLDSTGLQTTLQAALSAASICSNAAADESATRQHCSALRDCSDLPTGACSGVYTLHLGRDRAAPAHVFCDLYTDGGDWTVFQRRADILPRENFFRNWTEYKTGFGELTGESWWGLEKLWLMTEPIGRRYELRVDLEDFNGQRKHAVYIYQDFRVDATAAPTLGSVERGVKRQGGCPPAYYFQCGNGQCIERNLRCDGFPHCLDRSDEDGCSSGGGGDACDQTIYFTCSNGECIDRRGLCNGYRDCVDGSDEINCPPCDERVHFQCSNGTCIDLSQRCDGTVHCPDHSDEEECHGGGGSGHSGCALGQFRCRNGQCLNLLQKCDGRSDCIDGSDEEGCYGEERCLLGQHRCGDGQCLDVRQKCDGRRDCRDGSDEEECHGGGGSGHSGCALGQHRCGDGQCVDIRRRCDGRRDCTDASDEANCNNPTTCLPGQFRCSDGTGCTSHYQWCHPIIPCPTAEPHCCRKNGECLCVPDQCPVQDSCPRRG